WGGQGDLWLYTQCGLVEIPDGEMQKWWQQPDSRLETRVLDVFDGVQPGTPSAFGATVRSSDGRLWFGHGTVLQVIDPAHLAPDLLLPPVHVEAIVADRQTHSPQNGLRLPALTRDLEIDYT